MHIQTLAVHWVLMRLLNTHSLLAKARPRADKGGGQKQRSPAAGEACTTVWTI